MMGHLALGLAATLLSLALAAGGGAPAANLQDTDSVRAAESTRVPDSPQAFHGLGRLAFLRDGQLHILDGETDTMRTVAGSEGARAMAWSADGRWLAFLRDGGDQQQLLLLDPATGQVRQVAGLPGSVTGFQWSPTENRLAVSLVPLKEQQPADDAAGTTGAAPMAGNGPGAGASSEAGNGPGGGSLSEAGSTPEDGASSEAGNRPGAGSSPGMPLTGGGAIYLVEELPQPKVGALLTLAEPVGSLRWSPDGTRLAYTTAIPAEGSEIPSAALEVVSAADGRPVRWFTAEGAGIRPAGWWPDGQGLLFWTIPMHSASLAADGLPLLSLAEGAKEPVALGTTLLYPSWLSWQPGSRNLAVIRGSGRAVWEGKRLSLCDAASGRCRDLVQPEDQVSLDPAWSPDGQQIALVRAARRPGEMGFSSDAQLAAWINTRTLWVTDPGGQALREVTAAGKGVYGPAWSMDGRHLLFVRESALWRLDLQTNQAARIVSLENPEGPFGFYGAIDWWSRMAWHNGESVGN